MNSNTKLARRSKRLVMHVENGPCACNTVQVIDPLSLSDNRLGKSHGGQDRKPRRLEHQSRANGKRRGKTLEHRHIFPSPMEEEGGCEATRTTAANGDLSFRHLNFEYFRARIFSCPSEAMPN